MEAAWKLLGSCLEINPTLNPKTLLTQNSVALSDGQGDEQARGYGREVDSAHRLGVWQDNTPPKSSMVEIDCMIQATLKGGAEKFRHHPSKL